MNDKLEPAKTNAKRCVDLINQYWAQRGLLVYADIDQSHPSKDCSGNHIYPIVSNMKNGWPAITHADLDKLKEWLK